MTTVEILRAARTEIANPAKWLQGGYGTSSGGTCLVGHVKQAAGMSQYGDVFAPDVWRSVKALMRPLGTTALAGVFDFNDTTTHDEVLALLDRAIANEEAREQEFTTSSVPAVDVAVERILQVQP